MALHREQAADPWPWSLPQGGRRPSRPLQPGRAEQEEVFRLRGDPGLREPPLGPSAAREGKCPRLGRAGGQQREGELLLGRRVRAGCSQSHGQGDRAFPVVAGPVMLGHVGWQRAVSTVKLGAASSAPGFVWLPTRRCVGVFLVREGPELRKCWLCRVGDCGESTGLQVTGGQRVEGDMSTCQWSRGAGSPALMSVGISAKSCVMAWT